MVTLKQEVFNDSQKEYIDHLSFIFRTHMDKLHVELVAEIAAISRDYSMEVKPASYHAPTVTTHTDDTTANNGTKLNEVEATEDVSVLT